MGYIIIEPNVLNSTCSNATVTAAGDPVTKEAINAVIVVPMFAPKIYGNTFSRVKIPTPAKGTTNDDVTELL